MDTAPLHEALHLASSLSHRIGTHCLHFDARNSSQKAQEMDGMSSVSLGDFLRLGLECPRERFAILSG
eukprot:6489758-Amphidinium_carterae.1